MFGGILGARETTDIKNSIVRAVVKCPQGGKFSLVAWFTGFLINAGLKKDCSNDLLSRHL